MVIAGLAIIGIVIIRIGIGLGPLFPSIWVIIRVGAPVVIYSFIGGCSVMWRHIDAIGFIVPVHIHLVLAYRKPRYGYGNKNRDNFYYIFHIVRIVMYTNI